METPEVGLKKLRAKIDSIDTTLISTLEQRKNVEKEIGALKRRSGMKVLDPARRDAMLAVRIATGKKHGIAASFIRTLFELIHEDSLSTQKKSRS